MSSMNETHNIRPATPYARQRIVLNYVFQHPGQSQNHIATSLRSYMTRRVAIKHLKEMAAEGVLIEQRAANGAAYCYIAQANNPLVKVFQEAQEFEPAMRALIHKAASQIEFRYWEFPEGYMYQDALNLQKRFHPIFDLFKYFADFYLYRA